MTHSRVRHCKQWPIHQAELGESPTAWEGLLWEGVGGVGVGAGGNLPMQLCALSPSSGRDLQETVTRFC